MPYCVVLPILLWLFSFWQIKYDDDEEEEEEESLFAKMQTYSQYT